MLESVSFCRSLSEESVRLGKPEAAVGRMRVERLLKSLAGRDREAAADVDEEAALDARVRLDPEAIADIVTELQCAESQTRKSRLADAISRQNKIREAPWLDRQVW